MLTHSHVLGDFPAVRVSTNHRTLRAQQRWGVHLWGRHTIEARFKVTDSCGSVRSVRVQRLYFNHDPLPDDPIFAH